MSGETKRFIGVVERLYDRRMTVALGPDGTIGPGDLLKVISVLERPRLGSGKLTYAVIQDGQVDIEFASNVTAMFTAICIGDQLWAVPEPCTRCNCRSCQRERK